MSFIGNIRAEYLNCYGFVANRGFMSGNIDMGYASITNVDMINPKPGETLIIDGNLEVTGTIIGVSMGGGGNGWVGNATSNLDMNCYSINNVDDIKFKDNIIIGNSDTSATLSTDSIVIGPGCITRGQHNIGIGASAGTGNVNATGSYNIFVGYQAFGAPTLASAEHNVVIGSNALREVANNSKIFKNVVIGSNACKNIGPEGLYKSVVIGYDAGYHTPSAESYNSVVIGYKSGIEAYRIKNDVFIGYRTGRRLHTGDCVAIGNNALSGVGVGGTSSTYIQGCTAIGKNSLLKLIGSNSYWNTAVGYNSGVNLRTNNSEQNTLIGGFSAANLTGGSRNVVVGYQAGGTMTYGDNNVFIGSYSLSYNYTTNNCVAIGYNAKINSLVDGAVALGNNIVATQTGGFFVTHNSGSGNAAQWNGDQLVENISSVRFKQNIRPLEDVGSKIDNLKPIRYNPKPGYGDINQENIGLIAEDLDEIFPEFVNYEEDGETPKGISYERMIAILIKELQSVRARLNALENA